MKTKPHIQREIDRMLQWPDAEIRGEMARCGPGQNAYIAGEIIIQRRIGEQAVLADKKGDERHDESTRVARDGIAESRKANRLAWVAIAVSLVSLLVSAYSVFRSDTPEKPVAVQSLP